MSNTENRFTSVWDAIEDTPEDAERMKRLSELRITMSPELTDASSAAEYLSAVLDLDDSKAFSIGLRQVAYAQRVALPVETDEPLLSDVLAMVKVVGLRLSVQPA